MKKIFIIIFLVMLSISVFAQKYEGLSYDELISKSKKARTTGTIFVATGPVIAVAGVGTLIYGLLRNEDEDGSLFGTVEPYYYDANGNYVGGNRSTKKDYTSTIVLGAVGTAVGIALAVTSTHFMAKSRRLKKLARELKLKATTENINLFNVGSNYAFAPAKQMKFTLSIPLGR